MIVAEQLNGLCHTKLYGVGVNYSSPIITQYGYYSSVGVIFSCLSINDYVLTTETTPSSSSNDRVLASFAVLYVIPVVIISIICIAAVYR